MIDCANDRTCEACACSKSAATGSTNVGATQLAQHNSYTVCFSGLSAVAALLFACVSWDSLMREQARTTRSMIKRQQQKNIHPSRKTYKTDSTSGSHLLSDVSDFGSRANEHAKSIIIFFSRSLRLFQISGIFLKKIRRLGPSLSPLIHTLCVMHKNSAGL